MTSHDKVKMAPLIDAWAAENPDPSLVARSPQG